MKEKGFPEIPSKSALLFVLYVKETSKVIFLIVLTTTSGISKKQNKRTSSQKTLHVGLDGRIWPTKQLIEMWC